MATRTRDDSTKEKRGAPSLGKISPKPLKIDSPDPKVRTPTSSVPNYLKPTLSSGLEQQGKKPADAASASHKPMLNRRRSFDSKPQSPTTQAQRSRASLKPTQRSSSFSGKTTGSDKNSTMRGNKEGAARSAGTTVKKHQSSAGETSTMKKEENPSTKTSEDAAIENEIKDEEVVQIGDHQPEAVEIVKDDDQVVINEEAVSIQEDNKEHTTNEEDNVNDNNNNISVNDETAAYNVTENAGDKDLKEEEEEEAVSGESAAILSEGKESKVKEVVVVTKPTTEIINKAAAAKYQGKRESAVSNDVIEETASKLREQRKNKVKALAGAFETVISLQETSKYP